ncbi:hypothetical protein CP8484711_1068B, partial [Chlamydia psittaci 84-8471/1]
TNGCDCFIKYLFKDNGNDNWRDSGSLND